MGGKEVEGGEVERSFYVRRAFAVPPVNFRDVGLYINDVMQIRERGSLILCNK